jgi:predicted CoA-substrate-specific enzyme activase
VTNALRIGIDVGSTTTKLVAVNAAGEVVGSTLEPGEPRVRDQAKRLIVAMRDELAAPDAPVVATGYGRKLVEGAARVMTEISCHARGAFHRMRREGALIDVGGQDTKVIRIGPAGEVTDFAMNDKCAAGTGRFLEVILPRLGVPWEALAQRYQQANEVVVISSTCTVFAESEVISLLANGRHVDGIVKGLHVALADRVGALAGRLVAGAPTVFLSGGVANNPAMVAALRTKLGRDVLVVPEAQLVGALGAALAGT